MARKVSQQDSAAGYAVIVPVGPADETARMRDLVEGLAHFEPNHSCDFVIVEDAPALGRDWTALLKAPPHIRPRVIRNPRRGVGNGWADGLCAAVLAALHWIHRNSSAEFSLRLDTDSLVTGPFFERLAARFGQEERTGILGTYTRYPDGTPRLPNSGFFVDWHYHHNKLKEPLTLWRYPKVRLALQCRLFPRSKRTFRLLQAAERNGYRCGFMVAGGGYAVHPRVITSMETNGWLRDPQLFRKRHITEDAMMTIFAHAVGYEVHDYNAPGEVFGVTGMALPLPPEKLLENGYGIIHTVKTTDTQSEPEIRSFFRERRQNDRQ